MPSTRKSPKAPGREWREPWLPKGVRRCQGSPHLFQLRIRVGPLKNDSVNFGTYPSEYEASRVAREVRRLLVRGWKIWAILRELQARGEVSGKLLPRWVHRREDGQFCAKITHGPNSGLEMPGPYSTPELAHDAMRRRLRLPPLGTSS